jgi:hypothetical protein
MIERDSKKLADDFLADSTKDPGDTYNRLKKDMQTIPLKEFQESARDAGSVKALEDDPDCENGLISTAIECGRLNIVKHLVENCKVQLNRTDVNYNTPFDNAIRSDRPEIFEYLLTQLRDSKLLKRKIDDGENEDEDEAEARTLGEKLTATINEARNKEVYQKIFLNWQQTGAASLSTISHSTLWKKSKAHEHLPRLSKEDESSPSKEDEFRAMEERELDYHFSIGDEEEKEKPSAMVWEK